MPDSIRGIHHITAIASSPKRNLDFYTRVLGLRLVKQTVNFDDSRGYHFYFGDEEGRPGTLLTFFPWPTSRHGKRGLGQVVAVSFEISAGSLDYWQDRLSNLGLTTASPFPRFDEEVLTFLDPDGLQIELVARYQTLNELGWNQGPVPGRHMIRGLGAPALLLEDIEPTAELLSQVFGLVQIDQTGPRYRFSAGKGPGGRVDVEVRPREQPGHGGTGTVHHIAFRAPDNVDQIEWREILVERGLDVTPVKDRLYFQSIYFREPGGVLFEIATDTPGFTVDEPRESLGSHLMLPAWFEPQRVEIERALPEINVHPGQLM